MVDKTIDEQPLLIALTGADVPASKTNTDYRIRVGEANGLAMLDSSIKLVLAQLPAHVHAISDVTGLQTSLDTKAPLASPAFTGNPTAPTPIAGDNDTSIATTAFVTAAAAEKIIDSIADADTTHAPSRNAVFDALALKAPLASPAFTGVPTTTTAVVNTNTTQIASTAFVVAQIADDAPTKTGSGASGTWGISVTGSSASTTGNAATATALQTARNISLSGDVTGTVSFNGTANANIVATVVDGSHTHTAANISDSTTTGRNVLTAASEDAARDSIGIYVQAGDPGAVADGSIWLWMCIPLCIGLVGLIA